LILILGIGFILVMELMIEPAREREECIEAAQLIGLPTKYEHDACFVEIADGLWIREEEIKYNLRFVDVEKIDQSE